jgi:glutathione synthase/RimK-type ligase-like ATP-grasp enzyme
MEKMQAQENRLRIGILHHDLEWAEMEMGRLLREKGFEVIYVDVRGLDYDELFDCDCVLNRIYASVGNRDCRSNVKVLNLLRDLEDKGVYCLNSYLATLNDYSKSKSSEIMSKNDISNPRTIFIKSIKRNKSKVLRFAKDEGYPLIIKRDMGGRGKDVLKVENKDELFFFLEKIHNESDGYDQGFVVQSFAENVRGHDCRIAIVNGKFAFSFSRSLVSVREDESPWLASVSRGSKKEDYMPDEEAIELAKKATLAIDATFNEVDVTFCETGPMIIENNPTPNYMEGQDEDKLKNATDLIAKKIWELA